MLGLLEEMSPELHELYIVTILCLLFFTSVSTLPDPFSQDFLLVYFRRTTDCVINIDVLFNVFCF